MRKMVFRFLFSSFLLAGLITQQATAATVERLSLEDLVKKARNIVAGKVVGSRTYWSADRRFILTEYTMEVDEHLKGQAARRVAVTTVGGKIGDVELQVSGMPSFDAGEDAVVFLESSGPYQVVLGMEQGKFKVANGEVSNRLSGLSFSDGQAGAPVRMPLQTFKARIRFLVNGRP